MSTDKILTLGGFVKIPFFSEDKKGPKVRLYLLQNLTLERIKQVKEALKQEQEKKQRTYQGNWGTFEDDIQKKAVSPKRRIKA